MHTFRQPTRLVTSGIYALSRNPMYLGFLLMLLGVAVCTNEALNVLFAIVFFLVAQFWYIPIEERNAERTFGQPYLDYRKNVRRWL
ncbi:methyltransferase family protein [Roseibium aggregatum]|uniref:methyltransferase family protein n=1 Tax=Roseibium aggregatum TaxID=187304 RepID=UPI003A7F237F